MAAKGSSRHRYKRPAASRLRRFWIVLLLVCVLVGAGLLSLASWHGFDPHSVVVEGNRVVSTDDILASARIDRHRNIWLQNVGQMQMRIEALPYVRTAIVRRTLPAGVTIDIRERTPFATLRVGEESAVVDRTLRILTLGNAGAAFPVFLVRSADAMTPGVFVKDPSVLVLRDDAIELANKNVAAKELRYDRFHELVVELRSGINVMLGGPRNFAAKVGLIDPIVSQLAKSGRPIAAIDLRAPTTPVVVYK